MYDSRSRSLPALQLLHPQSTSRVCGIPASIFAGFTVTGALACIATGLFLFLFLFTRANSSAGVLGFSCAVAFFPEPRLRRALLLHPRDLSRTYKGLKVYYYEACLL